MSKIKTREWEEDDTLLKECWLTMEDFFLDLGRWLSNDYLLRDLFRQTLRQFVKMYMEILMGTSSFDGNNNDTESIDERSTSSLSSTKMLARCMARDLESSMSFFSRYEQVLSNKLVMNSLAPLQFAAGLLQSSLEEGDAVGSSKSFLEHLQSRPEVTEEAVSTSLSRFTLCRRYYIFTFELIFDTYDVLFFFSPILSNFWILIIVRSRCLDVLLPT